MRNVMNEIVQFQQITDEKTTRVDQETQRNHTAPDNNTPCNNTRVVDDTTKKLIYKVLAQPLDSADLTSTDHLFFQ